MNFVLLRPHVENAKGEITTPDVIVDRLFLCADTGLKQMPAGSLSHVCWLDVADLHSADAVPGVLFFAAGAGTLLSPAFILDSGIVSVARCAWRVDQVDNWSADMRSTDASAPIPLGRPARLEPTLRDFPGAPGSLLPRGTALLCPLEPAAGHVVDLSTGAPELTLFDDALRRSLVHRLHLEEMAANAADGAVLPRYSVGPQKESVTHYI